MESIELTRADYESLEINWTLAIISFTLLVYEYILTFRYEVQRFWPVWVTRLFDYTPKYHRRSDDIEHVADDGFRGNRNARDSRVVSCITWASLAFFLNRYIPLFGHVPVMWEYFWRVDGLETRQSSYHQFLVLVIQVIVACIMIMRVYALYERRIWVALLYVTLTCVAIGISTWAILSSQKHKSPVVVIPYGCGATLGATEARYLAIAWSTELVFDAIIFGMTLYKTLTLPRSGGIGLLTMLVRDGTIYFGVMVIAALCNILSYIFGGPLSRGSVTMFTNVISSTMGSRLMLNLRDPKLHSRRNGRRITINGDGYGVNTGTERGFGLGYSEYGVMTTVPLDFDLTVSSDISSGSDTRIMDESESESRESWR